MNLDSQKNCQFSTTVIPSCVQLLIDVDPIFTLHEVHNGRYLGVAHFNNQYKMFLITQKLPCYKNGHVREALLSEERRHQRESVSIGNILS